MMIPSVWTILIFSVYGVVVVVASSGYISACEKRVPNSFTSIQKQKLCSMSTEGSIGPAICATVAKDTLHTKFNVILDMCQNASTAAPAQCMSRLDNSARTKHGLALCKAAASILPADCFTEISRFTGSNRIKQEVMMEFCTSIEDRAPLQCLHAVKNTSLMSPALAIASCGDAVGSRSSPKVQLNNAVSVCINQMAPHVKPSFGISAMEVLQFCVHSNPRAYFEDDDVLIKSFNTGSGGSPLSHPAGCFVASANITASTTTSSSGTGPMIPGSGGPPLLTPKQRLSLCVNAPTAEGPTSCTVTAMYRSVKSDPGAKLKPADVVELCRSASSSGPADCYVDSKGLGNVFERTQLCNSAKNAGPAKCYRRSAGVFKKGADVGNGNRTLLCVSADSEDPATCAAAAPHYLAPTEKVDLCALTPLMRGQDAVRCLNAVESASRQYSNAPKKGLGYFLTDLWDAQDRVSRELLIHMCSFGTSQDPLAAAECLKSAPKALQHDDAVRMCSNISSEEVIQHMQFCHRVLPRDWASTSYAATLCEDTTSRPQVEAAVKCAVEVSKLKFPQMSKYHAAQLCSSEQPDGSVLKCAKDAGRAPASAAGAYLMTADTVLATCTGASTVQPHRGECLAKLASISTSRMIFDAVVPSALCALPEPMAIIACLERQGRKLVSIDDIQVCINTKQEVRSMKVLKLYTEDNDISVTAGRRFLVWFELLDQWGRKFIDAKRQYLFSAALNANNPQGAVLWGLRSNYSTNGILQLDSMVISQPGPVELRISLREVSSGSDYTESTSSSGAANVAAALPKLVDVFRFTVKEDPAVAATAPCVYIFKEAICPIGTNGADWDAEFPRIRSFSPALAMVSTGSGVDSGIAGSKIHNHRNNANYLRNIMCAGELLSAWHVNAQMNADGSMWVEYRLGIDAIWTGVGMPKLELSPMERLGLPDNVLSLAGSSAGIEAGKQMSRAAERAALKEVRRAYYRKSLQWHPDRWVGMSMYNLAVQGAFELITEAYDALTNSDIISTVTTPGPTVDEAPDRFS